MSATARSSPKFGSVTMMPSMLVAIGAEQVGAFLRVLAGLDGAELGILGAKDDGLDAGAA